MKTNYFNIFLSLAIFLMQSCSLDEKLIDRPTPSTITTEGDVTAVIHGMYARFNDLGMFKFTGHLMMTLPADDFFSNTGAQFAPFAQRVFTAANTAHLWDNFYATIASANNLISILDHIELGDDFKRRAYGEAYFIRAFSYYYLVRLYGGVPLRITPTTIESDYYLPRASVSETYEQIFRDFKAASEHLPLRNNLSASELGRATKGAAQAILAQAYLTYGDHHVLRGQNGTEHFDQAVTYADSVINSNQYSLMSNYADLFDIAKETQAYSEVIFGIRFQTDLNARAVASAGSEYALRFNIPNTWYVAANGVNLNGTGDLRVNHWFADYYREGDYTDGTTIDYRNEGAFWQSSIGGGNNTYYIYPSIVPVGAPNNTVATPIIRKYIDPNGKDFRNHGNDFFVIRFAEVYYIKAEAMNERDGAPSAEALQAFNTVRERARNADGTPRPVPADLTLATSGSKEEFRMKIFDDRGLELVGEGQRWFDLVRMPSPLGDQVTMYEYQFLHRFKNTLSGFPTYTPFTTALPGFNNNTKTWNTRNLIHEYALNVSVPKFLLFPVPTTEMIQNKNFGEQNPGWGI